MEESIHLLFDEDVIDIAHMTENHRQNGIGYMRDFRPNIPRSLISRGGETEYELGDKEAKFRITIEEVKYPEGDEVAGYLSQTPTGGVLQGRERRQYLISTLSFFFLVTPALLIDKEGFISEQIWTLQERVKEVSQGGLPPIFLRQEKMMGEALRKFKTLFV